MSSTANSNALAPSLLSRLTVAIVGVILLVFSVHAIYVYNTKKAELVELIQLDVNESLERLSKNIAPFIEAYAVNEYQKLVATETALKEHFAVVVQDRRMGEITNQPFYLSGQVLTDTDEYTPYDTANLILEDRLSQAFYSRSAPIVGTNGEVLGQISVYASDQGIPEKLDKVLLKELFIVMVLAGALTFLLVMVLRHYFIGSLNHINSAMQNRDSEGVPLSPIPDLRYRETGALGETINRLLNSVKESRKKLEVEQFRLKNTIKGTRTGTWEWNVQTGETVFNRRWAEIVGHSLEELGQVSIETWMNLAHPDDLERSGELLNQHFRGELPFYEYEARMKHKDGHWIWVLDRGSVLSWSDDGQPLMMYGTHQDITERKEAEKKLSMAASVFKYAREGIIITRSDGTVMDVNSAFCALTGYSRTDVINQNHMFLASGRHKDGFLKGVLQSLRKEGVWGGEYWVLRQNGSAFPSLMTIATVEDSRGKVQHYVTLFADVSHIKQNEDELRTIAHYDALTGLPNRILLTERLRHSVSTAKRRGDILAVVFLDLDGFKEVNDTYGHAAGDELLAILAARMKATLRDCDTVARLGGDEFVVLLPDLVTIGDAQPILLRLLETLSATVPLGDRIVRVSASIGVSLYPQDTEVDADILLSQADMAMYQAKQGGKNRYLFFKETASKSEID